MTDLFTAAAERDQAIEHVEQGASDRWLSDLRNAVLHVAKMRLTFSGDDVWDRLHELGIENAGEPRALGAVMSKMAKEGIITPTDTYEPSRRRRMSPIRVWRMV